LNKLKEKKQKERKKRLVSTPVKFDVTNLFHQSDLDREKRKMREMITLERECV